MTAQFQFVMRSGPTPGKVFPLEGPEIIIGRDNTSSMTINDAEVSRKHTRLIWQGSGYVIEDVGSTNGTFVNGQRLNAPYVLHGGETVSLGENISLAYESTADPNATMLSVSASAVKKAVAEAKPIPEPSQPQTPPPPPPAPAFAGQVPANPAPRKAPVAKKSGVRTIIILVFLLVLLCICSIIIYFLYSAPPSFWCKILPFIFNPQNYNCVP